MKREEQVRRRQQAVERGAWEAISPWSSGRRERKRLVILIVGGVEEGPCMES